MRAVSSVFAALALFTAAAQAGKRGLTWTYCKSMRSLRLLQACAYQGGIRQQRSVNTGILSVALYLLTNTFQ